MKKTYTKKQIQEAIKYWKNVLQALNESKNPLLDVFAKEFGEDVVFNDKEFMLNDNIAKRLFIILKIKFFKSEEMPEIPVRCLSYIRLCQAMSEAYEKYKQPGDPPLALPPRGIKGVHYVTAITDERNYNPVDGVLLADDDMIILNMSELYGTSFSFQLATLCHEMIHFYDRLYGEYVDFYEKELAEHKKYDEHDTPTFKLKMDEARTQYVYVVKNFDPYKSLNDVNNDAVSFSNKALNESENGSFHAIYKVGNRLMFITE